MEEELNVISLNNKIMQAVRWVQKKDKKYIDAIESLEPCFRQLIRNFVSMMVMSMSHEVVRRIQEFKEFQRTFSKLVQYVGPLEVFEYYEKENRRLAEKIMTSPHQSDFLLKSATQWDEDYFLNHKNKIRKYYKTLYKNKMKLQKETTNLENDLAMRMNNHKINLRKKISKSEERDQCEQAQDQVQCDKIKLQCDTNTLRNNVIDQIREEQINTIRDDPKMSLTMETQKKKLMKTMKEDLDRFKKAIKPQFQNLTIKLNIKTKKLKKAREEIDSQEINIKILMLEKYELKKEFNNQLSTLKYNLQPIQNFSNFLFILDDGIIGSIAKHKGYFIATAYYKDNESAWIIRINEKTKEVNKLIDIGK